jgi:hypothetical protein
VELGEAERHAGAGTATATLEAAMVEAGDLALYARAVESLADVHMRSGRALRAAHVLEEAVERLAGTPDAERLAIQLIGAGHVSIAARRHLDGRIRALALPEGEPRTSADLMALAAGAWGAIVDHGDAGLARELGARVLGFSGEADVAAISALIMTTVALAAAEDLATAGRVQENMLEGARRRGALQGVVALSSLVALTRWRAGDVAGSVDAADAALELGAEITGAEMLTHAGVAAALLAGLDAGRDPEALLGTLRTANLRRDADLLAWSQVLIGEAAVHAARGDHAAALDRLRACDLADSGWGRDCPSLVPWRSGAALSLAATGAHGDAAGLAEEEVELARRAGTPRALGWALRARALVGPASARCEGLERALAVLEPLGTPAVTARVRTDLGAQLRRDGERSAARELLSVAHGQAVACGAQAIADAAAAELRGFAG